MPSLRRKEGWLMIDHRASPGLPADFYQKIGLAQTLRPELGEGKLFEAPTLTCAHCQAMVVINPARTRARGYCPKCDSYVCDNPACHANCTPISKILDEAEKRAVIGFTQSSFVLKGQRHG